MLLEFCEKRIAVHNHEIAKGFFSLSFRERFLVWQELKEGSDLVQVKDFMVIPVPDLRKLTENSSVILGSSLNIPDKFAGLLSDVVALHNRLRESHDDEFILQSLTRFLVENRYRGDGFDVWILLIQMLNHIKAVTSTENENDKNIPFVLKPREKVVEEFCSTDDSTVKIFLSSSTENVQHAFNLAITTLNAREAIPTIFAPACN